MPMSSGTPWFTYRDNVSFAVEFEITISEHRPRAEMADLIGRFTLVKGLACGLAESMSEM
jgi:hypothetical protein